MAAARAEWRPSVAPRLDPHRVVFAGDTGADAATGRRHGCGPKGEPVAGPVPRGHYGPPALTAALRADGAAAAPGPDGPTTAARFRERVTAVLVPALRPGGTAAVGDRPCHQSAGVRAAIEAAGRQWVLLPAPRPDLSPIESALAAPRRASRTGGHREVPKWATFLRAAGAIFRPDECRAYIRHGGCGIPATPLPS